VIGGATGTGLAAIAQSWSEPFKTCATMAAPIGTLLLATIWPHVLDLFADLASWLASWRKDIQLRRSIRNLETFVKKQEERVSRGGLTSAEANALATKIAIARHNIAVWEWERVVEHIAEPDLPESSVQGANPPPRPTQSEGLESDNPGQSKDPSSASVEPTSVSPDDPPHGEGERPIASQPDPPAGQPQKPPATQSSSLPVEPERPKRPPRKRGKGKEDTAT
jgi:hypothetical protein